MSERIKGKAFDQRRKGTHASIPSFMMTPKPATSAMMAGNENFDRGARDLCGRHQRRQDEVLKVSNVYIAVGATWQYRNENA